MAFKKKPYTTHDFYLGRKPPTKSLASWVIMAVLILAGLLILTFFIFQPDNLVDDCHTASSSETNGIADTCKPSLTIDTADFSLERFTLRLQQEYDATGAKLKTSSPELLRRLEQHRRELLLQLSDPKGSYQQYIAELAARVKQLSSIQGAANNNQLNQARKELASGNSPLAKQAFEQIAANAKAPIEHIAESHYQLCRIAMDDYHYAVAFRSCRSASQLKPEVSRYLAWTARAARQLGRDFESQQLFKSALVSARKDQSEGGAPSPKLLRDLGEVLESTGQFVEAIKYYQLALKRDIKKYGKQHHQLASNHRLLGSAWAKAGKSKKAIKYFERALASDRERFNQHHPLIIETSSRLGDIWQQQGQHSKALYYYEQAMNSTVKTFDRQHPDVAVFSHHIGSLWLSVGQYDKALRYLEKTLENYQKNYHNDHPKTASLRQEIGNVLRTMGEYDKAIDYYEQALLSHIKIHGRQHRLIADGHQLLGLSRDAQGQYAMAVEHYEQARELYQLVLGKFDRNYLQTTKYLSAAQAKLEK